MIKKTTIQVKEMMNDIIDRFNRLKIGSKILIICLVLVIVPTLLLGSVAYMTASNAINNQLDMTLNTQVSDIRSMTSNSYDLSKTKLDSDLKQLRNRLTALGTPSATNGQISYGNTVMNSNYEIVDGNEADVGSKAII
ncbi:MAG: hypothetical protein CW742_14035, partial [Methanoregula sp.]